MPTYTFNKSLASVSDYEALGALMSTFLGHATSLGLRVLDVRVQGANLKIDTDIVVSAADLAHLGLQ